MCIRDRLEILSSINPDEEVKFVRTGALVETNKGIIFLSIPLGRIKVKNADIMVISAIAPLAKAMMNAKKKETVSFNGTDYLIKNIS